MSHATVVSRPASERTGVDPVLVSTNEPVPYVHLLMPGE